MIDLVIVVITVAAVVHGLWFGALTQLFSFGGLCVGLVAGAAAAPLAARLGADPTFKALLALACLAAGPVILGGLGRYLGLRLSAGLRQRGLGRVDAAIGAVIAGGATLVASWLVASLLATVPARPLAAAIQRSVVVRSLDRVLPPAPRVFARLDRLIAAGGLPQVFAQLEPKSAPRQPLPPQSTVQAAAGKVVGAVVKIAGDACGAIQEGSGFIAGPELVVTNAHVVAGVRRPVVIDRAGRHPATSVLFDPDTDIAVLRAAGLAGSPLVLAPDTVGPGAGGAVLGYPGGGPLDVEPAVVLARFEAVGRDIYGSAQTRRQVLLLAAELAPGDSGAALVDPSGSVVGIAFAIAPDQPQVAYALTIEEVQAILGGPLEPTSSGPCV